MQPLWDVYREYEQTSKTKHVVLEDRVERMKCCRINKQREEISNSTSIEKKWREWRTSDIWEVF